MIEVAEHLAEPVKTFTSINNALNVGGWLFISKANLESIFAKIRGKNEQYYKTAHVTYWSRKTIRLCLEKCGFRVAKITTMHNGNWSYFRYTKNLHALGSAVMFEILNRVHFNDTFLVGGMNVFAQKVKK